MLGCLFHIHEPPWFRKKDLFRPLFCIHITKAFLEPVGAPNWGNHVSTWGCHDISIIFPVYNTHNGSIYIYIYMNGYYYDMGYNTIMIWTEHYITCFDWVERPEKSLVFCMGILYGFPSAMCVRPKLKTLWPQNWRQEFVILPSRIVHNYGFVIFT